MQEDESVDDRDYGARHLATTMATVQRSSKSGRQECRRVKGSYQKNQRITMRTISVAPAKKSTKTWARAPKRLAATPIRALMKMSPGHTHTGISRHQLSVIHTGIFCH